MLEDRLVAAEAHRAATSQQSARARARAIRLRPGCLLRHFFLLLLVAVGLWLAVALLRFGLRRVLLLGLLRVLAVGLLRAVQCRRWRTSSVRTTAVCPLVWRLARFAACAAPSTSSSARRFKGADPDISVSREARAVRSAPLMAASTLASFILTSTWYQRKAFPRRLRKSSCACQHAHADR